MEKDVPKETVRTDQGAEGADCRSRSSGCGPGGSSGLAEPVRPAGPQHRQDRAPGDGRTHRSGGGDRLGQGTRPAATGERKSQDYYTVLILGRDTGGGGNTDTMLLASYDVTNQKATVMSIPGTLW